MADDRTIITPSEPPPSAGVQPGVQLNGMYEIDERIASGGMGEVYRGHNIQTGDPVAIKIVLPEFARDQSILALFKKEASILNHLAHEAIVRYHVFSIDPTLGRHYMAMEFVDGQSLAERIETQGPLTPMEARKMLSRVASGLALAHEAGVIHRDLSPDNIILPGGNVNKSKLIDFGIAKSANVGGGTLLGGKFAGKYNFVSPEQLGLFRGEVTERSDIYSLGLVMVAALRGEAIDMSGSQVDVIEKRRVVPDLTGLDDELRPLIEAMLQPDPQHRPESASDIVEWLRPLSGRSTPPSGRPGFHPGGQRADYGTSIAPAGPFGAEMTPPLAGPSWQYPPAGSAPPSFPPGSMPPVVAAPYPGHSGSMPQGYLRPDTGLPHLTDNTPPPAPAKPQGSSKTVLIAAGVAAVIVLGGLGAYFGGVFGGSKPAATETAEAPAPATPAPAPATPAPAPATPAPALAVEPPPSETASSEPLPAEPAAPATPATPAPQPEKVAAAGDVAGHIKSGVEWLKDYDGGPCFHAAVTSVSDTNVGIVGYGPSREPFDRLFKAYREQNGSEPDIQVRPVQPGQCAIVDFLRSLKLGDRNNPTVTLSKDRMASKEPFRISIGNIGDRRINLFLIDDAGGIYSLDKNWERRKNDSVGLALEQIKSSSALPHMIVAVATPNGIQAPEIKNGFNTSTLLPKLRAEMEADGKDAGAGVGYFVLGK